MKLPVDGGPKTTTAMAKYYDGPESHDLWHNIEYDRVNIVAVKCMGEKDSPCKTAVLVKKHGSKAGTHHLLVDLHTEKKGARGNNLVCAECMTFMSAENDDCVGKAILGKSFMPKHKVMDHGVHTSN